MFHNRFTVSVKSSNGKRSSFAFYDSAANYNKGVTELSADGLKDALTCFLSDAGCATEFSSADEMMDEYGWDTDSRKEYAKAKRIFKACQQSATKASRLGLDDEAMSAFNEALND